MQMQIDILKFAKTLHGNCRPWFGTVIGDDLRQIQIMILSKTFLAQSRVKYVRIAYEAGPDGFIPIATYPLFHSDIQEINGSLHHKRRYCL